MVHATNEELNNFDERIEVSLSFPVVLRLLQGQSLVSLHPASTCRFFRSGLGEWQGVELVVSTPPTDVKFLIASPIEDRKAGCSIFFKTSEQVDKHAAVEIFHSFFFDADPLFLDPVNGEVLEPKPTSKEDEKVKILSLDAFHEATKLLPAVELEKLLLFMSVAHNTGAPAPDALQVGQMGSETMYSIQYQGYRVFYLLDPDEAKILLISIVSRNSEPSTNGVASMLRKTVGSGLRIYNLMQ